MSETDLDCLPTCKMELAVTIRAPSSMLSLPHWPGGSRYHLLPTLLLYCKLFSISNNSPQSLISLCLETTQDMHP